MEFRIISLEILFRPIPFTWDEDPSAIRTIGFLLHLYSLKRVASPIIWSDALEFMIHRLEYLLLIVRAFENLPF
jgi:hypothetical protein